MTDRKRFQQMFNQAHRHFEEAFGREDYAAADRWLKAMYDTAAPHFMDPKYSAICDDAEGQLFNAKRNIA